MVAAELPKQLTYLNAPQVPDVDVKRLSWWLERMLFDDALLCGGYALERLAVDNSYVEWVLYYREWLIGVVEVRTPSKSVRAEIREKLARVLLAESGWRLDALRLVKNGAITPETKTFQRSYRLLERCYP